MVRRKVPSSFFSLSQGSPVKESRNKRVGQNEMQEGMAAPFITTISVRRKRGKQPLVPASQESDGMDGSSEEGDESMAGPKKKGRKEYVIHEEAGPSSTPSEKFPPLSEDGLSKMKKLALAMEEERTIMCLYSDGSYRAAKVLDKMWTPEGLLKYYVHYIDMSRRDDKWVLLKDLNPDLVVPPLSRRHDKLVLLKDLNPVSVVPAVDKKADTQVDCRIFFPPGKEIYADRYLAVFEADGSKFSGFAKNLCCLAKMFLDHKSLDFEVKAFTFYILGEKDRQGFHVAAYFSKEKDSENTLSCILTLPQHQRKGFGSFLIELAYELSKREGQIGRPERPLSDLGRLSFVRYWKRTLLEILNKEKDLSIKDLSSLSRIHRLDVIETLKDLDLLQYRSGTYLIVAARAQIQSLLKPIKKYDLSFDPANLRWSPPPPKSGKRNKSKRS